MNISGIRPIRIVSPVGKSNIRHIQQYQQPNCQTEKGREILKKVSFYDGQTFRELFEKLYNLDMDLSA